MSPVRLGAVVSSWSSGNADREAVNKGVEEEEEEDEDEAAVVETLEEPSMSLFASLNSFSKWLRVGGAVIILKCTD